MPGVVSGFGGPVGALKKNLGASRRSQVQGARASREPYSCVT
jgi:hypothetical protein